MSTAPNSEIIASLPFQDPLYVVDASEIDTCYLTPQELIWPMFLDVMEGLKRGRPEPAPSENEGHDDKVLCFECMMGRCSANDEWQEAFDGLLLRNLPTTTRCRYAFSLACRSRATPALIDRLIDCLDDAEENKLRGCVFLTLASLHELAFRAVPRAKEIVSTCRDDELSADALQALALCVTPDMEDDIQFLIGCLDHHRVGERLIAAVLGVLPCSWSSCAECLESLVSLIECDSLSVPLREKAICALPTATTPIRPFADRLAGVFAAQQTPLRIRELLCERLHNYADGRNAISAAYAKVASDFALPRELRFMAFCSFRNIPECLPAHLAPLAIEFLQAPPAAVERGVVLRLTAATLQSCRSVVEDPSMDAFLKAMLPAVFEDRHLPLPSRLTLHGRKPSRISTPDFLAAALSSPWLEQMLLRIVARRWRSLRDSFTDDVMQSLKVYLIELVQEFKTSLCAYPSDLASFPDVVLRRIDTIARHRLLKDHGLKGREPHGKIFVGGLNEEWDLRSGAQSPDEVVSDQERRELLRCFLDSSLSELERECLLATRMNGMTLDEAAKRLGISRYQVHRIAKAAEDRLRRHRSRFTV